MRREHEAAWRRCRALSEDVRGTLRRRRRVERLALAIVLASGEPRPPPPPPVDIGTSRIAKVRRWPGRGGGGCPVARAGRRRKPRCAAVRGGDAAAVAAEPLRRRPTTTRPAGRCPPSKATSGETAFPCEWPLWWCWRRRRCRPTCRKRSIGAPTHRVRLVGGGWGRGHPVINVEPFHWRSIPPTPVRAAPGGRCAPT